MIEGGPLAKPFARKGPMEWIKAILNGTIVLASKSGSCIMQDSTLEEVLQVAARYRGHRLREVLVLRMRRITVAIRKFGHSRGLISIKSSIWPRQNDEGGLRGRIRRDLRTDVVYLRVYICEASLLAYR